MLVSADGLLRLDEMDVVNNATVNTIQGPIYVQASTSARRAKNNYHTILYALLKFTFLKSFRY